MPDLDKKENLEAKARSKWCPFSRQLVTACSTSANRVIFGDPLPGSFCIASRCMAWLPVEGTCGLVRRDIATWDSFRSKLNASSTNQGDVL